MKMVPCFPRESTETTRNMGTIYSEAIKDANGKQSSHYRRHTAIARSKQLLKFINNIFSRSTEESGIDFAW